MNTTKNLLFIVFIFFILGCDDSNTIKNNCGDGVTDIGEECDGENLNGQYCTDLGFYSGILTCNADCTFNKQDCNNGGVCGDGILQTPNEICDGLDLNGADCASLGFYGGTLACGADCQYDTSDCETAGNCGDGLINGDELCDGTNISQESCNSLGYFAGISNNCNSNCIPLDEGCKNIIQWGTDQLENGAGVVKDSAGNYYVAGQTNGNLGGTIIGGFDIFMTKFDKYGNMLWTKQWGSNQDDSVTAITIDATDNIYITGWTYGSLSGRIYHGGKDFFMQKISTGGTILLTKQWGTTNDDSGNDIIVTSDGDLVITGSTKAKLDTDQHQGSIDIFVMKTTADGTKLWTRQIGTAEDESGNGVIESLYGNLYITGYTNGNLNGNQPFGNKDIFVINLSSNGSLLYTKTFGTSESDGGNGIASDSSGNIYVTGTTFGDLDGASSNVNSDIFIMKLSAMQLSWIKQLDSLDSDVALSIAVDTSNKIFISGYTDGNMDGNINSGGNDIFLIKYDFTGEKIWTKQFGTTEIDGITGKFFVTDTSDIFITGVTLGAFDGNANLGLTDIILIHTLTTP